MNITSNIFSDNKQKFFVRSPGTKKRECELENEREKPVWRRDCFSAIFCFCNTFLTVCAAREIMSKQQQYGFMNTYPRELLLC